jgi:hypothetical protein
MNKVCTKCKESIDINKFQKNLRYAGGYHTWCKNCKLNSQRANPGSSKKWVSLNTEKVKEYKNKYVKENPVKVRETKRKWSKANNKKVLAKTRKYQASKLRATPSWLTSEQIKEMQKFYINCPKGWHVDHIIPLQGKNVLGFHVPWNLQYLTASDNHRKSNKN